MVEKNIFKDKIEPNLAKIEEYKSKGLSVSKIAELLGISKTALYKHIGRNEALTETVKKGDQKRNEAVESAAFRLACGYELKYEEKEYEVIEGKKTLKSIKKKVKHVLPNPIIQIFLLKNLMPEKYKDRVEGNGDESKPIVWNETKVYKAKEVIGQDGQKALKQEKSSS